MTHKLPQKQPTKEKSPDTQWIDSDLRAMKTDDYTEGYAQTDSGVMATKTNGYTEGYVKQNISPRT